MEIETIKFVSTDEAPACQKQRKPILLAISLLVTAFVLTGLNYLAVVPPNTRAIRFTLPSQGRLLSGSHFWPSTKQPAPAVLFFHGSMTNKEWMTPLLTASAANGFHAFAIDQCGHGRSTGNMEPNCLGFDATTLVNYVSAFPSVNKSAIHLAGWSMGGVAVMEAKMKSLQLLNQSKSKINFRSMIMIGMSPLAALQSMDSRDYPNLSLNNASVFSSNLLIVSGRNDEIFAPINLLMEVAEIQGVDRIQEGTTYGNLHNGTGRKVVITGTDHMFEPVDIGVQRAVIEWVRATSEWSRPTVVTSGEAYELFSLFTGLMWISVVVASMAMDPPIPRKVTDATEEVANVSIRSFTTNEIVPKPCCCDMCCYWFTSRVPITWHGIISLGSLFFGLICLIIDAMFLWIPIQFFSMLTGYFIGNGLLHGLQYHALLNNQNKTKKGSASICQTLYSKKQRRDAIKPVTVFVVVFLILQIWLEFAPFDLGMGVPLFSPIMSGRRLPLYLFNWLLLFFYQLFDIACLRITVPLPKLEKNCVLQTTLKICCQRFVARAWFFLFMLTILFVPLVFAESRWMGHLPGFMVLFLVPLTGFSMLVTLVDLAAEMLGRGELGVAIIVSGIIANLFASCLIFG